MHKLLGLVGELLNKGAVITCLYLRAYFYLGRLKANPDRPSPSERFLRFCLHIEVNLFVYRPLATSSLALSLLRIHTITPPLW
jgi:hypothetical protein